MLDLCILDRLQLRDARHRDRQLGARLVSIGRCLVAVRVRPCAPLSDSSRKRVSIRAERWGQGVGQGWLRTKGHSWHNWRCWTRNAGCTEVIAGL